MGAQGIAKMALPPTLHQEINNPFPIDAAHCEDYPQDPTSPHDNISPGELRGDDTEGRGHARNNQIDHAEGG